MSTAPTWTSSDVTHRLNQFRRDDGRFGNQPPQPEAVFDPDDLDDIDYVDQCRLCNEWVDYCQGHGDWNSYETVPAAEVRIGDRLWRDGTEAGLIVSVTGTGDRIEIGVAGGGRVTLDPAATVATLPAEAPAEEMPPTELRAGDRVLIGDNFHTITATPSTLASEFGFDTHPGRRFRRDTLVTTLPAVADRPALTALFGDATLVDDLETVQRSSDHLNQFTSDGGFGNVTVEQVAHDLAWRAGLSDSADRLRAWMKTQIKGCAKCVRTWHAAAAGTDQCPYCSGDASRSQYGISQPWEVSTETLYDLDDAPAMERNRVAAQANGPAAVAWTPRLDGGGFFSLKNGR